MSRDEIQAWVDGHRSSLPSTLADLTAYPIPFRTVIASTVAHETRLGFWREHLASFTTADSDLTPEQKAFVHDAADRLNDLLAAPAPNPVIVAWEAQMTRLFSREQASRIFGTLGPPEPPDGLPLPPDVYPKSVA